jgi:RNA polymerase sigma factor (TIGR02999 family)
VAEETDNLAKLLGRGREGDQSAIDQAISVVYKELRRLAAAYLRNQPANITLQPTALVHEAYLRLVERSQRDCQDRAHFFRLAAIIMRQILVDHARAKIAAKRGGGARVEFNESLNYSEGKARDLVALDDALKALAAFDERKARVLELRYFGGLSVEETAEALDLAVASVGRETRKAEAWLRRELQVEAGKNDRSAAPTSGSAL